MQTPESPHTPEDLEPLPVLEPRPEPTGEHAEPWERPSDVSTSRAALWIWVGALVVLGALGWLMASTLGTSSSEETKSAADTFTNVTRSSAPLPSRHEAEQLISAYLKASTVDELLTTIHEPERVRDLCSTVSLFPREFESLELLARRDHGNTTYHIAKATTTNGDEESFVLFHSLTNGWRVDWETQVVYNPYTWATMSDSPPDEPLTLRVRAAPGSYYNFQFSNVRDYLCVELREPKGDGVLYGYIDRHTENSRPLMEHLDRGKEIPLMLRVQFPKSGKSENQVKILSFVQEGWLQH